MTDIQRKSAAAARRPLRPRRLMLRRRAGNMGKPSSGADQGQKRGRLGGYHFEKPITHLEVLELFSPQIEMRFVDGAGAHRRRDADAWSPGRRSS